MLLFLFALDFDEDVSGESDDEGSGSGFTFGSYVSSCFELSFDQVSLLLSSRVTMFIGNVR